MQKYLRISKKSSTFAPAFREKLRGAIAQLVEQRTENPCVPGSIPGGTTSKKRSIRVSFLVPAGIQTGVLRHYVLSIIALQCSIPGGTTVKKRSIRVSFLCLRKYKPGFLAARATIIALQCSIPGVTTVKKISIDKDHKVFKVSKDFREQKRP